MAWEKIQFDRTVTDIFGFHALQLGLSSLEGLSSNRMPYKWTARVGQNSEESEDFQDLYLDQQLGTAVINQSEKNILLFWIAGPCRSRISPLI